MSARTAIEIAAAVRSGERSALEVVDESLGAIDTANPGLNAFLVITADEARAVAEAARELIAKGIDPSSSKRADKQQAAVDIAQQFRTLALEWHSKAATRQNHAKRKLKACRYAPRPPPP